MKARLCQDCSRLMTVEEIHYYEHRCEACEGAWSDRIGAWMRGEIKEPELDSFYAGPQRFII